VQHLCTLELFLSFKVSYLLCEHVYSLHDAEPAASPDNVTATVLSSTSVNVSWDIVPPIEQNGPIVIYEVMYTPLTTFEGQIGTVNMNSTQFSMVLTELEQDVEYNISVQAYTVIGPGPFSSPGSIVRTFEDGKI